MDDDDLSDLSGLASSSIILFEPRPYGTVTPTELALRARGDLASDVAGLLVALRLSAVVRVVAPAHGSPASLFLPHAPAWHSRTHSLHSPLGALAAQLKL